MISLDTAAACRTTAGTISDHCLPSIQENVLSFRTFVKDQPLTAGSALPIHLPAICPSAPGTHSDGCVYESVSTRLLANAKPASVATKRNQAADYQTDRINAFIAQAVLKKWAKHDQLAAFGRQVPLPS